MILSDSAIMGAVKSGELTIRPFSEKQVNPNSYDVLLGNSLKYYDTRHSWWRKLLNIPTPLDCKKPAGIKHEMIPEEGFVVHPGKVYLFNTEEVIGSRLYAGKIEGKSSIGRLGLFIHVTAGWIDTGFEGQVTLEFAATESIRVYAGQKIAQVAFYCIKGDVFEPYNVKKGSKYNMQSGVQESLMHKNYGLDDK